jgi:hypothetical protein
MRMEVSTGVKSKGKVADMNQNGSVESSLIFVIEPGVGPRPILFEMAPSDVRNVLGLEPEWVDTTPIEERKMREEYPEFIGVDYDNNDQVYSVSFSPLGKIELRFGSVNLFDDGAGINPITVFLKADPSPYESYGFIIFDKIGVAVTGYHNNDRSQRAITVYKEGTWGLENAKPISAKELGEFSAT